MTTFGRLSAILFVVFAIVIGALIYQFILPKFRSEQVVQKPPKPKDEKGKIYPVNPEKETLVPELPPVPGTTVVRLAHRTWNSHQAWALANMGKVTDPGSIFARNGITMQFRRTEELPDGIAALKAMAEAFHRGETLPADGVHFFTIGGDASAWALSETNRMLKAIDPSFEAEIIGFSGFSAGENRFMGPTEWKQDPQNAKGGVVAGVPFDSDWNLAVFWCARHEIPFNPDPDYYDPNALNFVETKTATEAAARYIAEETVERIFLADGQNAKGNHVKKGQKSVAAISGVVTLTPVDKNIVTERGGLVTVASTKDYVNQIPQYIVGLKPWNRQNREVVVKMLASIFEASDRIRKSHSDLLAERIQPKSVADDRWKAARYVYELFESETPDDWYAYYNTVSVEGKRKKMVEVGGSAVSNLQQNLRFFGFGDSIDIGKVVYNRFAQLALQYDADRISAHPEWDEAFNPVYLEAVLQQFPELGQSDPNLPTFKPESLTELSYNIPFASGQEAFTPEAETVLKELLEQFTRAKNARFEIHAHTDSKGDATINMALSQRRGEAVYNWLKAQLGDAFPGNRVGVFAHGETDLLVPDQVDGAYIPEKTAMNRRVVLKIFAP
jgi:OmpA-OmpF porin, OOP family